MTSSPARKLRHRSRPSSSPDSMSLTSRPTKSSSARVSASTYSFSISKSRGRPASRAALSRAFHLRELHLELRHALFEHVDRDVGREDGQQRQRGLELEVLLGRPRDEVGEPVVQLARAGVGDLVDRAFGAPALTHGLARTDEAALLEQLDHAVERAVVEPDALVLGARAEGLRDLVRVHRSLVQAGEHGQSQGIGSGGSRHPDRMLVTEYPYLDICDRRHHLMEYSRGPLGPPTYSISWSTSCAVVRWPRS